METRLARSLPRAVEKRETKAEGAKMFPVRWGGTRAGDPGSGALSPRCPLVSPQALGGWIRRCRSFRWWAGVGTESGSGAGRVERDVNISDRGQEEDEEEEEEKEEGRASASPSSASGSSGASPASAGAGREQNAMGDGAKPQARSSRANGAGAEHGTHTEIAKSWGGGSP